MQENIIIICTVARKRSLYEDKSSEINEVTYVVKVLHIIAVYFISFNGSLPRCVRAKYC